MKAILTMEMPRNCAKCPLADDRPIPFSQEVLFECRIKKRLAEGVKAYGKRAIGKRPEWCPLREMPEREDDWDIDDFEIGYCCGWNKCIDEIEGRKE